jgi:hypothetical protein
MEETVASNVLTFKARASDKDCDLSRTLTPKEAHTLSMLIRQIAGELKTEEAEVFESTERVFGVCDLRHIPAKDLDTVTNFLEGLVASSSITKAE